MPKLKILPALFLLISASNPSYAKSPDPLSPWEQNLETFYRGAIDADGSLDLSNGAIGSRVYDKSFSAFPPISNARQPIGSARIGTSAGFGCDGINMGSLIEARLDEYGDVLENMVKEAPSFLILWFAYSDPVFATVLNYLNGEYSAALDLGTFSCANAKQFAEDNPFTTGTLFGKEGCVGENGGASSECVGRNPEEIKKARKKKMDELENSIDSTIAKIKAASGIGSITNPLEGSPFNPFISGNSENVDSNGTPKNVTKADLYAGKIDTDCYSKITSESNFDFTNAALLNGGVDCVDNHHYRKLLPSFTVDKNNLEAGIDTVGRESTVAEQFKFRGDDYFALIHSVIADSAITTNTEGLDPKNVLKESVSGVDADRILSTGANQSLHIIQKRTGMIFEPYFIAKMADAYINNPPLYNRARYQLSSQFAFAEISKSVRNVQSQAINGLAVLRQQKDLPESTAEGLAATINSLSQELEDVKMTMTLSAEINESQRALFDEK